MKRDDFEQLVSLALDEIPRELTRQMRNVVILVEDEAPQGGPELLGLYVGTPLTERGEWWAAGSLPDRILIFRNPILRMCANEQQVAQEVRVTVRHEVAHHFGISDARLHELGWG